MRIELRFARRPAFSTEFIATVIAQVEQAVFQSEHSDLIAALEEFQDIPSVVRDAVGVRIERYRGQSLQLDEAHSGSLILIGSIAGLAYWILDNTLKETLREAWRESDLHKKLKDFFLSRRHHKLANVQRELGPQMHRYRFEERRQIAAEIEVHTLIEEETLTVVVIDQDILPSPPTYDQALRADEHKNA